MLPLHQELKGFILGPILWIPICYFIIPIIICFYIASRIVHLLARLFNSDLIPISKSDAFTSIAPSNTPSSYVYTCQIWRVKGYLDVDAFRNHFHHCFLSTEEDRRKYVNLYCHFVQYFGLIFKKRVRQIDLHWHIHEHRLEDGVSLEEFVGKWMVTHDHIDTQTERPTWMIKLIPNQVNKETTVIFKLHHGICDGYTIIHLVDRLSGQCSPYLFKEPVPPLLKRIKCIIQLPYILAEIWIKMYNLQRQKKTLVEYPKKMEQKNKWLMSFCTLDLETLKGIRRVTKTHFVSVLMSIQTGALRRFLKEVNPGAKVFNDIPLETYIGHSMGWPNHPVPTGGGGMANHLTLNTIKASFHVDDPLERLIDLDKNFRESKSKGYPVMTYYVMFNLMKHSPAWFTRFLLNAEFSVFAVETGLSTLLASPNKHYLLGHPVENIWLPVVTPSIFPRMKLMTVPVSHSGILDISINAEDSLVKNQEMFERLTKVHFVQELETLRQRCLQLVE